MSFTAPVPLSDIHDLTSFSCGEVSLDAWFMQRALDAQTRGSARTYVVCTTEERVAGYYALSAGSVVRASAPGRLRRNMPDPVPVIVLGRLAVDEAFQGSGLGSALLKDAMIRSLTAVESIGAAALVVHALNDDLRTWYQRYGFMEFPEGSRTFFLPMRTILDAFSGDS